jgi:hypothetical protein
MKYQETTAAPRAASPVSPVSLSESAFLHSTQAGAGLPALKAFIYALSSAVLVAIICYRWWPEEVWFVSAVTMPAVFLLAFYSTQREWSRLIGLIELWVMHDLDGRDGIGNMQPDPEPVEVEKNLVLNYRILSTDGTDTTYRQRLPISPEDMQIISNGIVNRGLSLAEDNWRPKSKGKPFGDTEFKRIINALHAAKFIRYVDPEHENLGYKPTRVGQGIFEKYATPPLDDLPQGFTRF